MKTFQNLSVILSILLLVVLGISPVKAQNATPGERRGAMTVPSGSEIVVRTSEAIDSATVAADRTFPGVVEQDVMGSNGEVLIPKGSAAELVVRQVSSGGTTGSAELALGLQSINIGGHHYTVSTGNVNETNQQGIGKNKRTGEMVGGGAALGTLLGAVAGGGKGALIGALAGAAAGGTAQVLTRGKEVKVPAESTLRFRLEKPMHLQSASS